MSQERQNDHHGKPLHVARSGAEIPDGSSQMQPAADIRLRSCDSTMTMPNTKRQFLGGIFALTLAFCSGLSSGATSTASKDRPNILFILADDLGYSDLSAYGQTDFQTPNLDQLAQEGVRFTQAYANSAVCSATRFSLITGRYQYRLRGGLEEPIPGSSGKIGLPPSHPTLPSLLKKAGYQTALIGKWHLGFLPMYGPLKSGYDQFFGNYGGYIDYFTHRMGPNEPDGLYQDEAPVRQAGYYTDLLADRASDYINKLDRDKPFFLSLHFTAPHWPWEGPDDEAESRRINEPGGSSNLFHADGGNLDTYAKMVKSLDAAVGRVLKTLEKLSLAENTIVIFTSDNGGERFSRTWPFTGQKTELLEGGIRVPALVRWPARIKPAQTSPQVMISMDWMPTLLAATGTMPDGSNPPDGESLLPQMLDNTAVVPRTLFWRYKAHSQRAVRSADWKYLKINGNEFLFNVAVDQREKANLSQKYPQILAQMKQQWEVWNATMLQSTKEVYSQDIDAKVQADHYHSNIPD